MFLSFGLFQEDWAAATSTGAGGNGRSDGSDGSSGSGSGGGDDGSGGDGSVRNPTTALTSSPSSSSSSSSSYGPPLSSTLPRPRQGGFDRVRGVRGYLTHSWIQCTPPLLSQRAALAVTGR